MNSFRTLAALAWFAGALNGADLRNAVILVPAAAPGPEQKAAQMLTEEIAKRTQIRLEVTHTASAAGRPAIALGTAAELGPRAAGLPAATPGADGYRLKAGAGGVAIAGNDARGTLFGAGYLLRHLRMERQILEVDDSLAVSTAPRYRLRGHQLGYRPKVNTYDGWTPAQYEQYIRDLAVFGTNTIELIPPRSDDADDSPHFLLPKIDMMAEVSRICDEYGIDVWIWYPAMDRDYSNPATVEFALNEWAGVFHRLPRIDAVFVPGGDPGSTEPKYLMALLEKQTESLHRFHPKAQMWMSPQSFSTEWLNEWFDIMNRKPAWLSGVVYGPQVRMPLPEFRAKVPAQYPIRRYPDITHSRHSQYPVPDWDLAYATTEGREVINPRPTQEAQIFHLYEKQAIGFSTYSEGVNDDVNKFVWSGLGWNPDTPVVDILREFGRYFIGERFADSFAQGLLALERNWVGPLAANAGVDTTLEQFQSMEHTAPPQVLENWRFQQALYRAYYDYYDRARLIYETQLENQALDCLHDAPRLGSLLAMTQAEETLNRALTNPVAQWARARVFELAEALFQSIRMQLSVPRYKAIATERGANLDTIDLPLNNRVWLVARFADIRKLPDERERLKALDEIVNWTNPGPGGFYDDLGNLTRQPHLVRGAGFANDPAYFQSSMVGFAIRSLGGTVVSDPRSWWDDAEALYDAPLEMVYHDLDRNAQYKIRVVYAGDSTRPRIRLTAANGIEIHGLISRPVPFKPLEFDIPHEATATGTLDLKWYRETGLGDAGRGLQVAEVWLIRK
ncbi:MAG TPA: glycoside hydrolase family 20 zincin-like fold domain-containing protein [Bryobacteraceae bacterium]|nr:glycoside hydrolase family 20 zincin-like fold domain-containing protein [Bryobacteraceae bacterium]